MILIDSNIIIAYFNKRDSCHEQALKLMKEIDLGKYGAAIITDYIFDEVVTVLRIKVGRYKACLIGTHLLKSFGFVNITQPVFEQSWKYFSKLHKLSFTDCTNVTVAKTLKSSIATMDKEFKKTRIKIVN